LLPALPGASAASAAPPRAAGEADLFQPADTPLGGEWELWVARYNEWFQEIPFNKNPAVNPDSKRNCEVHFKVTMFGPTGTGEGCTVRAGSPVLLSFMGYTCSTAEGNGRTFPELRRCAINNFKTYLGSTKVKLYVDGQLVTDPRRWTFVSAEKVVNFPDKNIWNAPGGPTRSMGKGVYFMLKAPAAGEHLIRGEMKDGKYVQVIKYPFTAV
jgi:hypothetical protein